MKATKIIQSRLLSCAYSIKSITKPHITKHLTKHPILTAVFTRVNDFFWETESSRLFLHGNRVQETMLLFPFFFIFVISRPFSLSLSLFINLSIYLVLSFSLPHSLYLSIHLLIQLSLSLFYFSFSLSLYPYITVRGSVHKKE